MTSLLSDYYFSGGEVLVLLILVGGAGGAVCLALGRRWLKRLAILEQDLVDTRSRYDREYLRALHDHLHSSVSHEVVKGLDFISKKSAETLDGLREEQTDLRDKQHVIIAKASEMIQHADNITHLFAPEPGELSTELLSIRQVVEHVLLELYPDAQSEGVTLMPDLDDLEPVALNRDSALLVLRNVIHNAIRYSHRGGVVEITLSLQALDEEIGRWICIDVTDKGIGISEEDRDKIFELRVRGDGLIEPGSGLGLYCAREAARRLGGDVILVGTGLNQGSVFRIIFPYCNSDFKEWTPPGYRLPF